MHQIVFDTGVGKCSMMVRHKGRKETEPINKHAVFGAAKLAARNPQSPFCKNISW
jgi:hypothetical protein